MIGGNPVFQVGIRRTVKPRNIRSKSKKHDINSDKAGQYISKIFDLYIDKKMKKY